MCLSFNSDSSVIFISVDVRCGSDVTIKVFSSSVCVAGRHSYGQFVSWCVCWGLQEVECALLFSLLVQRRAAWRFPDAGPAAGLRYAPALTVLLIVSLFSVRVQEHKLKKTECTYTLC